MSCNLKRYQKTLSSHYIEAYLKNMNHFFTFFIFYISSSLHWILQMFRSLNLRNFTFIIEVQCVYITYKNQELNVNGLFFFCRSMKTTKKTILLTVHYGTILSCKCLNDWVCNLFSVLLFCLSYSNYNQNENILERWILCDTVAKICRNQTMTRMLGWFKKKKRRNVCVFVHLCVGLFVYTCDLVHAVLSSVAAEKQYCYLMKLLLIKMIMCTYHYYTVLLLLCYSNYMRFLPLSKPH